MWQNWHKFYVWQLKVFLLFFFPLSLKCSLCCVWLVPLPEFWGSTGLWSVLCHPNHSFIRPSFSLPSMLHHSLFLEGGNLLFQRLVIFSCSSTLKVLSSSSVWEPLFLDPLGGLGVHLFYSYHSTRGHHSCSRLKEAHSSFIFNGILSPSFKLYPWNFQYGKSDVRSHN